MPLRWGAPEQTLTNNQQVITLWHLHARANQQMKTVYPPYPGCLTLTEYGGDT